MSLYLLGVPAEHFREHLVHLLVHLPLVLVTSGQGTQPLRLSLDNLDGALRRRFSTLQAVRVTHSRYLHFSHSHANHESREEPPAFILLGGGGLSTPGAEGVQMELEYVDRLRGVKLVCRLAVPQEYLPEVLKSPR